MHAKAFAIRAIIGVASQLVMNSPSTRVSVAGIKFDFLVILVFINQDNKHFTDTCNYFSVGVWVCG